MMKCGQIKSVNILNAAGDCRLCDAPTLQSVTRTHSWRFSYIMIIQRCSLSISSKLKNIKSNKSCQLTWFDSIPSKGDADERLELWVWAAKGLSGVSYVLQCCITHTWSLPPHVCILPAPWRPGSGWCCCVCGFGPGPETMFSAPAAGTAAGNVHGRDHQRNTRGLLVSGQREREERDIGREEMRERERRDERKRIAA